MDIANSFPVTSFYFHVEIEGVEIPFQSVSGLGVEYQLKDRTGIKENYNIIYKEIVMVTYPNITLKRGILVNDPEPWKERRARTLSQDQDLNLKLEKIRIEEMFISLVMKNGVILNWTLNNLVPQKWQISALDSMNSEFLTETVEFAYEKLMLNH